MSAPDGPEQRTAYFEELSRAAEARIDEGDEPLGSILFEFASNLARADAKRITCFADPHYTKTEATHCYVCGEEL
jgi:hypothetical protein